MALYLDEMRELFAKSLASDPAGRFRMDKAFAHCIEIAYQRGMDDGKASFFNQEGEVNGNEV